MVEFYHGKKRRGIAGQHGRSIRTGEPKPYWPGLEIDEQDIAKANGGGNINVGSNSSRSETTVKSNVEASKKDDAFEESKDKEESKAFKSSASLSLANGSNSSNTKRSVGDASKFRSRKRRRKLLANHAESSMDVLSKAPQNNSMEVTEEESPSNAAKPPMESPKEKTVGSASTAVQQSIPNKPATKDTASASEGARTVKSGAAFSNNDQASVSSSDTKATGATPRALVKFLVQKKLPILDRVVSDIRDVLFGMVSRSPALLQKHLPEVATVASQSSHASAVDDGDNSRTYVGANSQGGIDPTRNLGSGGKINSHEDPMPKFLDICKRQEKMLDRMGEMELAAAKREELFSNTIEEQKEVLQKQKDQNRNHQDELLNLTRKLERANRSIESHRLKLEEREKTIEDLEESKQLVQSLFQTRMREQFRVIEKHINSLKIERAENEKLRKKIALLEKGGSETNKSPSFLGFDDPVPNAATSAPSSPHQAYSNRIRHRHTNVQQQKNLCSLQSADVSSRNTLVRDETIASSPNSPAYNHRIRRFPREDVN